MEVSSGVAHLASEAPVLPRLQMQGIRKSFGATKALAGVDLEVHSGEVLALIGENGAGKSTLMKVLAGVHTPDAGSLSLEGADYCPRGPLHARQAGVAMIHQELAIAPDLTVAENVVLGVEPQRGPFLRVKAIREQTEQALSAVGLLHVKTSKLAGDLSVAEQQLLEIGRAVVSGCRVLVLDEPTSSLTREDVQRLFKLIAKLRNEGLAIIYISHFMEEIREVSDTFTVLRDGSSVGSGKTVDVGTDALVAMMVGRDVKDLYPRSERAPGEPILVCENVSGVRQPIDAELTVLRGEVVGIAGIVGAGRTELLRTIFGLDPLVKGSVRIASFSGGGDPAKRWKQGVGLVSEDRKSEGLALERSIAENMTLTALPVFTRPAKECANAEVWVKQLEIKCASSKQAVGELSGGNQQKVALGRLLHHDADIYLLDEPTRGIDIGAKALFYRMIDTLACQGKAVLIVSSYLPELLGVCDRIGVMCRGRLGPLKPVESTNEHQIMLEATGGVI